MFEIDMRIDNSLWKKKSKQHTNHNFLVKKFSI